MKPSDKKGAKKVSKEFKKLIKDVKNMAKVLQTQIKDMLNSQRSTVDDSVG